MAETFEEIQVEITPDKMEAYLTLNFVKGEAVSLLDVERTLFEKGVKFGILKDTVHDAVVRNVFSERILIAKGTPPAAGEDSGYTDNLALKRSPTPRELADGRVDHYELGIITKVEKDTLLVTKTPPGNGVDGTMVTGEKIPARRGKDIPLPQGDGTVLSKDGTKLYAERAGHAYIEEERICVRPLLLITGDVGFSTGNIDFPGKVVISGCVKTKFKVSAENDVIITGDVEGAEIRSKTGNVIIQGGIKGGKKAVIEAHLQVSARFAEYATLISKTAGVSVEETLFHCEVTAAQSLHANRGKGIILGGRIQAGKEVLAKVVGARSFIFTELILGTPEQQQKLQSIVEKEKELNTIFKEITKTQRNPKMAGSVPVLEKKANELKERLLSLKKEFNDALNNRVEVVVCAYPGVSIDILGDVFEVNQEYRTTKFHRQDMALPVKIEPIA